MGKHGVIVLLIGLNCLATACASRREIIRLEIEKPPLATQKGVQVILHIVDDARAFNEDVRRPDAPSLRSRKEQAAALEARAVGRKWNMYNDPEGEWLLDAGTTVADLVSSLTEASLAAEGYEVLREPLDAREDAVTLDLAVKEYWAWCEAEAFRTNVRARMVVVLTFDPPQAAAKTLRIETARQARVPGKYDWQETFRDAHEQYIAALRDLLKEHPVAPPVPDFTADVPVKDRETEARDTESDTDTETESDTDTAAGLLLDNR